MNIGLFDRVIRHLFAILFVFIALKFSNYFWIVVIYLTLSGLFGRCFLYTRFGVNTMEKEMW